MDSIELQQAITDFGIDTKNVEALAEYIEQTHKEKEKRNGWTNTPTWQVTDELIGDIVDAIRNDNLTFATLQDLADYLAQQTGSYLEINTENLGDENARAATAIRNYANNYLSTVNWPEIAQSIVDEYPDVITG